MDPFARDSDTEDERTAQRQELKRLSTVDNSKRRTQASPRGTAAAAVAAGGDGGSSSRRSRESSTSRPTMSVSEAGEDDEGPPASIVLDAHSDDGVGEGSGKSTASEDKAGAADNVSHLGGPSSRGTRNAQPDMSTTRISESVRLGRLGKQRAANSNDGDANGDVSGHEYASDEERDVLPGPGDEEAGLMGTSRRSIRSSARRYGRRVRPAARDNNMISRLWRAVQQGAEEVRQQDDHVSASNASRQPRRSSAQGFGILNGRGPTRRLGPKERALWHWGTLDNMDDFLQQAYTYYVGKGLACIVLTKVLNLLTIAFVIGFSTFLVGCVDYSSIKHNGQLSDVVVGHCTSRFSGLTVLFFGLFVGVYTWQVVRFGLGISKLMDMNRFYTHLLEIPDADVQAISWSEVVNRIARLRETHPTTSLSHANDVTQSKLDAHDVANRIMRQENYLVALFNKDVLNLNIPIPGLAHRTPELTRSLEWNLSFCLLGFLFDRQGQVRRPFIQERHRAELIEGLRNRFIFMAVINAIFAPFIVLYLLFYSFFRYFEEYHKNPSYLGSRQYTQFARWKFREFNELPHLFRRRCHNSYTFAQRYIEQFPRERTAIIARFVSFIAGSFTAVLLLASVIDPDLFVHFDITPQRNVLFYIGVFGAILAVSRALVPADQVVFEPELMLHAVIEYTHYMPKHWKGHFHSADVHAEFSSLYRLKLSIFVSEILSVIVTPFILWKSLPKSAPAIIDFFREYTVHVDGLGYVCSFAVFDFKKHGNAEFGAPQPGHNKRMSSKEGKMEQSLLGFRLANPSWQPTDQMASLFLSRLAAEADASSGGASDGIKLPPQPAGSYEEGSQTPRHTLHGPLNAGRGSTAGSGGCGGGLAINFTPANSALAQRSQLYTDAFERSILLASKPSNALALQASALKTGPRSVATGATGSHGNGNHPSSRFGGRHTRAAAGLQAVDEDADGDGTAGGSSNTRRSSVRPSQRPALSHGGERDLSDDAAEDVEDPTGLSSMYEDADPAAAASSSPPPAGTRRQLQQQRSAYVAPPGEHANLRDLLQHIGTSQW